MKNRKNIDELFRERFEEAEVTPPPAAWANIADRLPQKKKKRLLVPIWYKIAGVAALLLLSLTLTFDYFGSSPVQQVSNRYTSQDFLFQDDLFNSYETQMTNAAVLLEKLIQDSKEMQRENNLFVVQQQEEKIISEVVKNSEEIMISEILDDSEERVISEVMDRSEAITLSDSEETPSSEVKEETSRPLAVAEELLAGEKSPEVADLKEESSGRLSINTRATPLFEESGGKDGTAASFSYGVSVAYNISENISLRAGINKMDLSYSNAGVPFVGQPAGIAEAGNITSLATPEVNETEERADFLEVPLEMEYALIDRKLNLNLIGGGSFVFLNSNQALPQVPVFARTMEKQPEPEDFGLTTNLGIGLGYELLQQLEIHVEPMIKIRLNSTDSALSPYYFGVYSGFSYRF